MTRAMFTDRLRAYDRLWLWALVLANLLLTFAGADHSVAWQAGDVYRFTARDTDDGWRLTSVRMEPVWRTADAPRPPAAT